jgi:phosphoenolpyruvate phosphomutase
MWITMLAIILASGQGKRLQPLTNERPKPLVKVDNIPLLGIQLDALQRHGITKTIITTGPFADQIHSFTEEYTELDIKFAHNEKYAETNYIYSLWLAGQTFLEMDTNEDIILLHGDLVFEDTVLKQLLAADVDNGVIVDQSTNASPKDFCVSLAEERISEIDTYLEDEIVHQLYPIYKLSREGFAMWLSAMGDLIEQGRDGEYAEAALNTLLPEMNIQPVLVDAFCTEVDIHEDLQAVEKWWNE